MNGIGTICDGPSGPAFSKFIDEHPQPSPSPGPFRCTHRADHRRRARGAPAIALIDPLALSLRRLGEVDQFDSLQRAIKLLIGRTRELYLAHPTLPAKAIIDEEAWETTAASEIDQATDFHEAYARAGYQAMLALDVMTMAVSPTPPQTAGEAIQRAGESVVARVKAITARLTTS